MAEPPRAKYTFRLPPALMRDLADYATRKKLAQASIVEAALASHLSPDGADRLEAALARRLDRMTRQIERMERQVVISNEAIALFVRFWLTSTAPLPDSAHPPAQAKGRERWEAFVEALGRRLAKGKSLADEVTRDLRYNEVIDGSYRCTRIVGFGASGIGFHLGPEAARPPLIA